MTKTKTDLHLGICPSWDFDNHVKHSLLGISIQWNVMERRNEPGLVCYSSIAIATLNEKPKKQLLYTVSENKTTDIQSFVRQCLISERCTQ